MKARDKDRDVIIREYLDIIISETLADTTGQKPMREEDLVEAIQYKASIPVDSETLSTSTYNSLEDLVKRGIIKVLDESH